MAPARFAQTDKLKGLGLVYFHWENLDLRYEPFPIGLIKPVMDEDVYLSLVDAFPTVDSFVHISEFGSKYSLSEKFNPRKYAEIIIDHPRWREFHRWVKGRAFSQETLGALRQRHIDLGVSPEVTFST